MLRPASVVIGIETRTRNSDERDPERARIPGLWGRFMAEAWKARLPAPATAPIVALYSDYESDHDGAYTLTIGCETGPEAVAPAGCSKRVVAPGRYVSLVSPRGPLPGIVIEAWRRVWEDADLTARRKFVADFEIYDERAADPRAAQVELQLGVRD